MERSQNKTPIDEVNAINARTTLEDIYKLYSVDTPDTLMLAMIWRAVNNLQWRQAKTADDKMRISLQNKYFVRACEASKAPHSRDALDIMRELEEKFAGKGVRHG